MKRIITITILVISYTTSSQTMSWNIWDNFDNFSYSGSVCRIDSNNNIYTRYSTRVTQFSDLLYYVEKYNANGERVTSFGSNGILNLNALLPGTGSKFVYSFQITNDEKLLFLAKSGLYMYFLKLNSDGTLDTSLNGSGVKEILTDTNRYNEHYSPSMIKGGDNYFMIDNFETILNVRTAEVHCFDDSGNLVTTFSNQGHLVVNYGTGYTYCSIGKIIYINNSLYVFGNGYLPNTTSDSYLTKLNPITSLPDTNFGTNGQLLFNNKYPNLIQANGKIIYIRTVDISPAQQDLLATRYLSDGITIDNTFANNGTMTVSAGWTSSSSVKPYNLPNGDMLFHYRISLFATDKDAVMYVTNSGVINTSFGGNIIDNGNPVLGSFGLPTYKANPGSLSLGADYFVTTSERQALPQNLTTTKVNYSFPALSTNENTKHGFKILPNPVDSEINIESNDAFTTVRIYNIEGRLLKTSETKNPTFENKMDVSSLSKGVYIIEVQSESKRQIQKLVKN